MKLFVAIEVGAGVREAATRLIDALRRRVATVDSRARVSWVTPERLHVTVCFIGEVDDATAAAMTAALGRPLSIQPFDLVLVGVGVYPPSGRPRVVWAGATTGAGQVVQVAAEIARRLARPELATEVSPHLTLGRIKPPSRVGARALLEGLAGVELGTLRVEAVTLCESRQSPRGPQYVPLCRTRLGSDASETADPAI